MVKVNASTPKEIGVRHHSKQVEIYIVSHVELLSNTWSIGWILFNCHQVASHLIVLIGNEYLRFACKCIETVADSSDTMVCCTWDIIFVYAASCYIPSHNPKAVIVLPI